MTGQTTVAVSPSVMPAGLEHLVKCDGLGWDLIESNSLLRILQLYSWTEKTDEIKPTHFYKNHKETQIKIQKTHKNTQNTLIKGIETS